MRRLGCLQWVASGKHGFITTATFFPQRFILLSTQATTRPRGIQCTFSTSVYELCGSPVWLSGAFPRSRLITTPSSRHATPTFLACLTYTQTSPSSRWYIYHISPGPYVNCEFSGRVGCRLSLSLSNQRMLHVRLLLQDSRCGTVVWLLPNIANRRTTTRAIIGQGFLRCLWYSSHLAPLTVEFILVARTCTNVFACR